MSLTIRLQLLLTGNVINQYAYDCCLTIIELFKKEFDIELNERNAQQYITHLASALMRVTQQDMIDTVDPELYQEIIDSPYYEQATLICDKITSRLNITIPDAERQYLIMNHCYIIDQLSQPTY